MGPGEHKNSVKTYKTKSFYPTGTKGHMQANLPPYMNTYPFVPVNEHCGRSNLSMLPNSPMSKGRVNPMFPSNVMCTPFMFILMLEIGSSPERIRNTVVESYKKSVEIQKQVTLSDWFERAKGKQAYYFITSYWMQVREERDGKPVSLFSFKRSSCELTIRPNSAGMGPGV